jgi:N,N-dimethylformamidase beta subunit-like, C-terminal
MVPRSSLTAVPESDQRATLSRVATARDCSVSNTPFKVRGFAYLRHPMLLAALTLAISGGAAGTRNIAPDANPASPIAIENRNPGTSTWKLKHAPVSDDQHNQIKGYADQVSVDVGGTIAFKVTVNPAQRFSIGIFRIGWYQGHGGRFMRAVGPLDGVRQPKCPPRGSTRLVACNWATAYSLTVPKSWVTGQYIVKLRNASGFVNWISFVVRDDSSHAPLLFQSSVNTWEAYNTWGGEGLYGWGSARAREVSFDRPYDQLGSRLKSWEIQALRFIEHNGYDVSYTTDVDTDADPARLLQHRALLVAGHDEYWTWGMRDAVEGARDHGMDVAFFGANDSYWQIRYAKSPSGVHRRVIVGYKEAYRDDPDYHSHDPAVRARTTGLWRYAFIGRPEQLMTGEMYAGNTGKWKPDAPFVVAGAGSWLYEGTDAVNGQHGGRIVGHEYDAISGAYPRPAGTTPKVVGRSPVNGTHSDASMYTAPSGAIVFDAGTLSWDWGLDGLGGYGRVSPLVQQMTRNLLDRFVQG